MVIYDNNGAVLLDIEVDDTSVRYKAIKGENSLTLKFSLAEHLEVPLGAYCVFKNETYSLMLPEDLTLHHRRDFEYTLVMYSEDYKARRYKFVNPVDRRLKFSLTAKPIEHLQMFVDNMNMRDRGWELGECPDHVEIVLSYNHTYCHDALVQLANELELDYWFNGKIVNLGKLELNKDNPLQLSYGGDGEGLKSDIKRTNYSDGLPIEVLYVQGSSTNIDPSKYRVNDKPVSELHLPISQTIGFDGTYFEDEDGYDATKARQYKTDENGFSVRRADRDVTNHSEDSLDCSEIEPTKTETIVSVIDVNTEKHFYDILFESTVDYSKYIIGGENATVVFQSGMLAGKEFDLATDENGNLVCKQDGGKWRVEIVPQDIDGITMPDKESGYLPAAGDTFKVFGIQLPDEYVSEAEMEMLRYAVKHMYLNEDVQYTIAGELDEIYSKRNWDSIKDRLSLGNYISFSDKSFQTEPLLIRIIGIKEFVNKPYSPQLEISNAALSGTLVGALNRIENQEVRTEDMFREAIGFTKRRWRDAKDTISMLQGAIDGFSEGITPITVETMSMLVGDERLQFVLTDSLTSDGHADLHYEYDAATRTFSVQSAFIKHITLGIDSISPVHTDDEYKRWYVIEKAEVLESEFGYYLYAKVSKSNTTGSFELSKTTIADDDEWYYLLVGIINSEYNGDRSFASMYGYTEVRPGQITTDSIRSSDGMTWLDLLKGILYLNNMAGVSGVKTEEKGDQSIAAWFGGLMKDIELDEDKENAAKSVIRHDGTGYFADGLFKWDKDTGVNLGNDAIRINYDGSVDFGGNIRIGSTGEETLDSLMTIIAKMSEMWSLDSDYNLVTDKQVIIKNNLVIHGDTASGGEGESNPVGISGITVNGVTYRDTDGDGLIDLGTIESGVAEITSAMVIEALGYTPYNASNPSGYITASALAPYATHAGVSAVAGRVQALEEAGFITASALNGYALANSVPTLTAFNALRSEFDALESALNDDVSGKINTWNEIVDFLNEYSGSEDLATILAGINADIAKRVLQTDFDTLALEVGDNTTNIKNAKGEIDTLKTDKADKATTLAGYGITDAYTKDDLATYKAWWDDVMSLVVKDGGNIKIKTNLIVEGDTASTAQGTDSGTSGTLIGVVVNGTPYDDETNGMLDLSELMNQYALASAIPSLDGYAKLTDIPTTMPWGSVTNKPTFATVATSGNYSDLSGLPTIPTKTSQLTNDSNYITGITLSGDDFISVSGYKLSLALDAQGGLENTGQGLGVANLRNSLKFGSKYFDGSEEKTITASDLGALTAHQSIYGLTIKNSAGTQVLHYNPASSVNTLTLTKDMVGLGNVDNTADANKSVKYATSAGSAPASDVYAWAKKSSLAASDVPDLSSKYLPLSGGILDGNITLRAASSSFDSWLKFTDKGTSEEYAIGIRRPTSIFGLQFKSKGSYYTIYHSGNFNPADYLPLSGGTISGAVTMSSSLSISGSISSVVNVSASGTFSSSSSYPFSLFAVGSGTYNRATVEFTSSGLVIERARKTDSSSAAVIPLIISQRGGGVAAKFDGNNFEVTGNTTIGGNLVVAGDTSSGSDIRFKDKLSDHRIALSDIAEAPLFTFTWNDREDDSVHLGTSAQYWDTVAPWLVKGEDFKTLDYSTLGVAIGISLANKSMNHEERIKILEKENKALKGEIRRMRHGLCN